MAQALHDRAAVGLPLSLAVLLAAVPQAGTDAFYVAARDARGTAVWRYAVHPVTGVVVQATRLVELEDGDSSDVPLVIESSGRFLYVGDLGSVLGFGIDPGDGRLTPVPGSPFRQGADSPSKRNIIALAPHPSGRFLYAVNAMEIWVYSIDSSTGALAPVPGSPFVKARPHAADRIVEGQGTLQIVVVPFADVTLDEGARGRHSSARFSLEPGAHVVVLSHPEYQPLRRKVTILPGATERLVVDLSEEAVRKRR